MSRKPVRIGVMAPGVRIDEAIAAKTRTLALAMGGVEVVFHPQCFLSEGHFAGPDEARLAAFLALANDPGFDGVWFARGGYGACRFAEAALAGLEPAAREKAYLGYSDAGFLLAGLYRAQIGRVAHGPMPVDLIRPGGEAAVTRALAFLKAFRDLPSERPEGGAIPTAAFNITILSQLMGTALEPDLAGHEVSLEEVGEHMYRIDRALFHITSQPRFRRVRGLRLGRCGPIPPNDPPFEKTEEEVAAYWCARAGVAYLGRADIGHDIDNAIVPFGAWPAIARF